MKKVNWVLGLILLVIICYLLFDTLTHRRSRPRPVEVSADVGSDSIAAYRQRVADLKDRADRLRARLAVAGREEKPAVEERQLMVAEQIRALEQAILRWEVNINPDEKAGAYRQCILYYGRASGMCEALAPDTLSGK